MSAFGLAIKPIVGPIINSITSSLLLPGGVIAGAIYLIWPMLALLIINRKGSAILVGIVQGTVISITGIYGSHGIISLAIYSLPCIIIEFVYFTMSPLNPALARFVATAAGNVSGMLFISVLFIRMPLSILLIGIIPAFLFGGFAGIFANLFSIRLMKILGKSNRLHDK